jgi:DNA-binding helix-hairpin-helix protein with protein kinase domain
LTTIFRVGQIIKSGNPGDNIKIVKHLNGGTQGEIHLVAMGDGRQLALKWYRPEYLMLDTGLRNRLEDLVRRGPPSDKFAWPLHIVESRGIPGFGYLMTLIEDRFVNLRDYLTAAQSGMSFSAIANAGYELATAFGILHTNGLCYHDISYSNVFVDPRDGDIIICDNDNVDVNGRPGVMAGSPAFKAPEIVRGQALPNAQSDLHSLAVLLFFLLMVHDPLEGRAVAAWPAANMPDAIMHLYGTHPIFIWHPTDESNRPVPGHDDNAIAWWPIYPSFLRELFTIAFTSGLSDPNHGRVTESVWRMAMVRLRDAVFHCSGCSVENYDDDTQASLRCWSCETTLARPARLRGWANSVVLRPGKTIVPHHIDSRQRFVFAPALAQITTKPGEPNRLGLCNISQRHWTTTFKDGSQLIVAPARTLALIPGARVDFNAGHGEIMA